MAQTVLAEKQLYENRNYDDVFNRAVIAGILKVLNRRLVYSQIWNEEEDKVEDITVPFFYNFGGSNPNSEKFIQDNYTFFGSDQCTEIGLKKVDGNFDIYPRGSVEMVSSTIDSGNIVNRFAMANYQRKVDGELESFVSFIYSIPLTYTFKVSIKSETLETEFKIEQAIREFFYKNKTFYIYYRGLRIGCRAGFPDAYNGDKASTTYTMGGDHERYITQSWDIAVETYQPVFDRTSEIKASNYIKNMSAAISGVDKGDDGKGNISLDDSLSGKSVPAGIDLMLTWKWSSPGSDIGKVTFYWTEIDLKNPEESKEHLIGTVDNTGYYDWVIPVSSDYEGIDIIIYNNDNCSVNKQPDIKAIPDAKTNIVTPENVVISNKGYFITSNVSEKIEGAFSYINNAGKLVEHPFTLNIYNHMINMENPIEFKPFLYEKDYNPKVINITIKDSLDNTVTSTIENIYVI